MEKENSISLTELKIKDIFLLIKWLTNKENLISGFGINNFNIFNYFIILDYIPDLYLNKKNRVKIIQYQQKKIGFIIYIKKNQKATLGILIGEKEHRNKGLGQIALKIFIENLFKEDDILEELLLETTKNNKIAQHVFEKVGFIIYKQEGHVLYYKLERQKFKII